MQKEKNRAGVGRESVPHPFPRYRASYFRGRPYYLRAWRRLATLHPFRNASREEYFCKRYFRTHLDRRKRIFFENDDVLVPDPTPDKKCLLPHWLFLDF